MTFEEFKTRYEKVPVEEYPNEVSENPLVSVCVQTYQHAPYIRECLDGILMQKTDFPFEILLGEDDSTDGTREICIEYAEKYPDKIRLFLHHRANNIQILGTPTGRFNTLSNLFYSKGKYIALCEGDDYWTDSKKLQKQFTFMEKNKNYVICGHNAVAVRNGELIAKNLFPKASKKDFSSKELQLGAWVFTLSSFFRNIQLYPEEVMNVINFDTFLFVYLGQYGDFKYIDDIKPSCYRLHPGGMWSSKSENFQQLSKINTNFWISKYFERTGEMYLRDHYGINIINRVLHSMIEPKWRNYYRIIAKMFAKKFLILSRLLKKLLVPDK